MIEDREFRLYRLTRLSDNGQPPLEPTLRGADYGRMLMADEMLERHLARLLLTLHYCGEPVTSLLEGDTRQIDSITRLQRFDFWMREPGHLALALLHAFTTAPEVVGALKGDLQHIVQELITEDKVDTHRVPLLGAPYRYFGELDDMLAYLTSRALVSDRPSFTRAPANNHQIILETPGIRLVERILAECPSFAWYKNHGEAVAKFSPILERYDLTQMPYLAPDLTPSSAVSLPLLPYIVRRAAGAFDATPNTPAASARPLASTGEE